MTEKQYADFFRNKWKMKIIENSEGWEANGFYIRSEESVSERKTIRGAIQTPITEWAIYGTVTIPATHFEPEEHDEEKLDCFDNFGSALARILVISYEDDINNSLNDFEEMSLTMEINRTNVNYSISFRYL